jgi:hypothetical protein
MHLTEQDDFDDGSARQAGATPEELKLAEKIYDALRRLAPDAFMNGDPRNGRMRLSFDGEFNIIELIRALGLSRPPDQGETFENMR